MRLSMLHLVVEGKHPPYLLQVACINPAVLTIQQDQPSTGIIRCGYESWMNGV